VEVGSEAGRPTTSASGAFGIVHVCGGLGAGWGFPVMEIQLRVAQPPWPGSVFGNTTGGLREDGMRDLERPHG
jgi:hypothetical protein